MMDRRRALMGARRDTSLLYHLENHATSAGDSINTGIFNTMAAGINLTVLFDMDMTMTQSGDGSACWIIRVYNSNLDANALAIRKATSTAIKWWVLWQSSTSDYDMAGTSTTSGRYRFCVTHEANSNTVTIMIKKDSGAILTFTITRQFYSAPNVMVFGHATQPQRGLPAGTINLAEIYNRILSSAEINAFFA